MRKLALCWLVSVALMASPALAQVYKWVDESGKVNYGDKPPPGSKDARPLDEEAALVSVVPGIPKEELDRLRSRDRQQRAQQLEREVDELRARELAQAYAAPETVYAEVYLPVYGHLWPARRFPAIGHPGRWPNRLIARLEPPVRPRPLASQARPLMPK